MSTFSTPNGWVRTSFALRSLLGSLTSQVRFRFSISDAPDNSITEAGLDDFAVTVVECVAPCRGDFDGNGSVNGADLSQLLSQWGGAGYADMDGSGTVNGADLAELLSVWGPCP